MLAGKCCLAPAKDLYPGFAGTTAQVVIAASAKVPTPDTPAPIDSRWWRLEDAVAISIARALPSGERRCDGQHGRGLD
jgi:hypothetical protein